MRSLVNFYCQYMNRRYPDNSPPGQFACPDNSPPIFKQPAPRSFIHYRAKRDVKYMIPRLNAIEIILPVLYPLPNKLFLVLLSTTESEVRGRVVWGELSRGHRHKEAIYLSSPVCRCRVNQTVNAILFQRNVFSKKKKAEGSEFLRSEF